MRLILVCFIFFLAWELNAQKLNAKSIPPLVKSALANKYSLVKNVVWEKEKGNYEANWGGKSGEDSSILFTPSGDFIEMVIAIPTRQLPESIESYTKKHFKGSTITEAGLVKDAKGNISYEVEIDKKDLIFDASGHIVKN